MATVFFGGTLFITAGGDTEGDSVMAANAQIDLSDVHQFKLQAPLEQGRRFTLIRRGPSAKRVILFVHGLKSSAATWQPFIEAAYGCHALNACDFAAFEYHTAFLGRVRFPFRKVDAEDWARVLADTIEHQLISQNDYDDIILVGHSMGGLVCKMAIRDLADEGNVEAIEHIHSVFTYATPHFGSDRAFAPVAALSYDVSFLRANSKPVQALQRFWNTRVGADKDFQLHERAIVSASDEVVPVVSGSGGLSQKHIFHVATSHTEIHRPENANDRRITWFCQELDRIDRRSHTRLVDIHKLPDPTSYNADNADFFIALFKMVFVLDGGSADGVDVGDQFQLFYEPEPDDGDIPATTSRSAIPWNLLTVTRVEKHQTFATLENFSGEIAMRRAERLADKLAISPFKTPTSEQIQKLIHGMFDHAATRIPRAETKAAQATERAKQRLHDESRGSSAWQRANHDVLQYAEEFLNTYPQSALAEGLYFDRAFALKTLGRLEEAQHRFQHFVDRFPFSVSALGAHNHLEEIEYRMAASAAPDDLFRVFRLGTFLMGHGDFVEGAHIVWDKLRDHIEEIDKFGPTTRLDLFALFIAGDLMGERFVDQREFYEWLRHYRVEPNMQQRVLERIQTTDEPDRALMQALHQRVDADAEALLASF
ncbi:MAG: alpha/beta fold hydrolase [Pseudomonadota bacterium]